MAAEGERRAGALGDRERIYEYHGRAVGLLVVAVIKANMRAWCQDPNGRSPWHGRR